VSLLTELGALYTECTMRLIGLAVVLAVELTPSSHSNCSEVSWETSTSTICRHANLESYGR